MHACPTRPPAKSICRCCHHRCEHSSFPQFLISACVPKIRLRCMPYPASIRSTMAELTLHTTEPYHSIPVQPFESRGWNIHWHVKSDSRHAPAFSRCARRQISLYVICLLLHRAHVCLTCSWSTLPQGRCDHKGPSSLQQTSAG